MIYPVEFDEEGPTVIASLPDLPGTYDEGATREEALRRLRDAAIAMLQDRMDDREDIPDPSPDDGRDIITLPSQVWTKVLLYRALREKSWRKADLARALAGDGKKADPKAVERLFDLFHASRWDQIDDAFAALDKTFVPRVEAAPARRGDHHHHAAV